MEDSRVLINYEINTNLEINCLMDLNKLKEFENNGLKVNKSEIARRLGKDRRTVDKYIKGYTPSSSRNRKSQFDEYYDTIKQLLNDNYKVFAYKRVLWQYLKDNHGLPGAQSSFRRYISSIDEFDQYFKEKKKIIKAPAPSRFETKPGHQAQIDWKENLPFVLKNGETITINIFSFIMSYSRFRVYRLSLSKTQDVLFHFMDEIFEILGGVPKEIVTDNMKTVMDEARTEHVKGKINNKFYQFSKDYNFKVHPCIAGRPNTKAKVESPMKILDEILAYSGELNYDELSIKIKEINDRENSSFHESYQGIPILDFENEKTFLEKLPPHSIRRSYQIATIDVKVNKSSMISYKSRMYSVPPKYIDKQLQLQVYDNQLHLYYNTELVTVHIISESRMNYHKEHYEDILAETLPHDQNRIKEIAKENLENIGARYKNDRTRAINKEPGISKTDGSHKSSE